MRCCYCGTQPNNKTTKNKLYVCSCYMLQLDYNTMEYKQYFKHKLHPHTTKRNKPATKGIFKKVIKPVKFCI